MLVSCVTFAPAKRRLEDVPLPESFSLYGPTEPVPERWWQSFDSPELDQLVEQALSGNFTVQQALARIRQAVAVAKQSGAFRWPDLSYNTQASVTRTHVDSGESVPVIDTMTQKANALTRLVSTNDGRGISVLARAISSGQAAVTGGSALDGIESGLQTTQSAIQLVQASAQTAQSKLSALETLLSEPPSSEMTFTTESYLLGLTTGYEVDLWGRLRASRRAAQLNLEATREDLFAAMQTVAGQVVLTWLDVLEIGQVLDVVQKQLDANRTMLELVTLRYRKGLATALDVYQQRQVVAQSEAAIPPLEAQRDALRHQLAVLIGKVPGGFRGETTESLISALPRQFPEMTGLPEQGLPADLLAQRPDVRAAGLRLRSADWQVSAARADRLPGLRLSASASYGAEEWDLLLDNWMAKLAGSVTGPVFDAGRRKAEVARTRAVVEERLAAYKERVLVAVREVEDALMREARQREYIQALKKQYEAAQATHREALARFRKGLNDYLPVLSALTTAQSLERAVVRAEHDLRVYRVQLHLALGGTWMRTGPSVGENRPDDITAQQG